MHAKTLAVLLILALLPKYLYAQTDWPQFRGPASNPTSENDNLPEEWGPDHNIEWSSELPGRGWSSPIVVRNRVFLTTVVTDGQSKSPQAGTDYSNEYVAELTKQGLSGEEVMQKVQERDFELPDEVDVHYWLYCLDVESGEVLWKDEFHAGKPQGGRHRKNSFASETPVSDGEQVYVYSANLGLFAYDLDGKQSWNTKLHAYPIYLEFGTGSSPALHDGLVIIVNDNEESAFIAAFDTKDGSEVWRTLRKPAEVKSAQGPVPKSGWVTPFVWKNDLRAEIITLQPGVAISYDTTGRELWRLGGMTVAPAASSFAHGEYLILDGGKRSAMFAVKPGASGEIKSAGDDKSEFVQWVAPRTGTYIPTPVAYLDGIYVLDDKAIITKLDPTTGKQVYKHRLGSSGATITSSPWAYNGKVFCLSEQGDTYVLQAGDEYKLLGVNSLDDFTMASPAISGDRLLLRTEKTLYSIRRQVP
ncbi:MAG: PQQ-binding-like beta-propeller repeat protein [Aureliella sp.]